MIPEVGTIGFSPIRDTIKTIYIKLNDVFLERFGLEYAASMADLESALTAPAGNNNTSAPQPQKKKKTPWGS